MRFIRLKKKKEVEVKKPNQYRVKVEKRAWRGRKGKVRKIKIRWHYFKEHDGGKRSKHVFIENGLGTHSSGHWHLKGFDLKHPERFVAFYDKKVAKKWAKKNKFKVTSRKRWIKRARKQGITWPLRRKQNPAVRCPHCNHPLNTQQLSTILSLSGK